MARGYPNQFGHKLNAPYVWLPLAAIFLLGLFDFPPLAADRAPGPVGPAQPSGFLGDLLQRRQHRRQRAARLSAPRLSARADDLDRLSRRLVVGLRPSAPTAWLAIGAAFLLGFRIALNIADSGVIDVGYAGVIGADHITHGQTVWGLHAFPSDNPFGDTYGPFNYYAYVPFELLLPWHGTWDNLPAAHAAAIFFDLATVAGLFVLGRRLARESPRRRPSGLRLVRLPVHRLCAAGELERLPGRGPGRLGAGGSSARRGHVEPCAPLRRLAKFPLAFVPLFAAGARGLGATPTTAPARPRFRACARWPSPLWPRRGGAP